MSKLLLSMVVVVMTSVLSFLVVIFVLVHVVAYISGGCAAAVWKENIEVVFCFHLLAIFSD